MLIPAGFILRSERTFDRRPIAAFYGLLIGLTGRAARAVQSPNHRPRLPYLPDRGPLAGDHGAHGNSLLHERLLELTKIGIVLALIALVFFNLSGDSGNTAVGPWLILALLITLA